MSTPKKRFIQVFIAVYLIVMVALLVFGNMKMDLKASEMALFETTVLDGKTVVRTETRGEKAASRPNAQKPKTPPPILAPNIKKLKSVKLARNYEGGGVALQAGWSLDDCEKDLAKAVNNGAPNRAWVTGESNVVGFDMTLILIALNFLGLLAILYLLLWDPIIKALDNRAGTIRAELETARTARTQADELLDKYNTQLDDAREQRQKLISDGRSEGQNERERIVGEAREEAEKVLERGRGEIETELGAARSTLRKEVGGLAVGLAERILRREINEADQKTLVTDFLDDLEKNETESP